MNNSRNKILISIIAILLLANIFMLVFFFSNERGQRKEEVKKPGFTERLKKEVKFDSAQMRQFETRKKAHWSRLRQRFDEMTATKENFYRLMYDTLVPDSILEAKASIIGQQQKELDLQVFRHFREVRKLCTPEQLPRYDSLFPTIIRKMTEYQRRK